jgi:hypothetical protein
VFGQQFGDRMSASTRTDVPIPIPIPIAAGAVYVTGWLPGAALRRSAWVNPVRRQNCGHVGIARRRFRYRRNCQAGVKAGTSTVPCPSSTTGRLVNVERGLTPLMTSAATRPEYSASGLLCANVNELCTDRVFRVAPRTTHLPANLVPDHTSRHAP